MRQSFIFLQLNLENTVDETEFYFFTAEFRRTSPVVLGWQLCKLNKPNNKTDCN
jgi:hypothetical protein